jgi:methionyl-tRNA formyltransferase
MNQHNRIDHRLRVLFLGMASDTSSAVLDALLAGGVDICGVAMAVTGAQGSGDSQPIAQVAPDPGRSIVPLVNPFLTRNIAHIAWEIGVPVYAISRPGAPEVVATLAQLRPDVACVACFPKRLPGSLLALPALGCLNMHPSLLPHHRGPEPLFWTFRNGERTAGVTIHFMDEGLDTGDIAAQAPIELPDGVSGAAAERKCAALGGQLMVETLERLRRGALERRSQPARGSYEPQPAAADWTISTIWPARRAFNFMRGTAEWGRPYAVEVDGEQLALDAPIAYDASATLGAPYVRTGDIVAIRFTPGVLHATIVRSS